MHIGIVRSFIYFFAGRLFYYYSWRDRRWNERCKNTNSPRIIEWDENQAEKKTDNRGKVISQTRR